MRMMVILFASVSRDAGTTIRESRGARREGSKSRLGLSVFDSPPPAFCLDGSDAEVLDCMIETFQHAILTEHREHVKQTGADGFAGNGHPTGVHERACFHIQFFCQNPQAFVEGIMIPSRRIDESDSQTAEQIGCI